MQIDLAAPKTAPFLSKKFQNGLTCRNITVKDCVIRGNRALTCNFAKVDKKFRNRYHYNKKQHDDFKQQPDKRILFCRMPCIGVRESTCIFKRVDTY